MTIHQPPLPRAIDPAAVPTMYFIGVTTAQSSMMRIFPRWSVILGLQARLAGYDAPIHAQAETYRAIVRQIKEDPRAVGALVTTHKIDLLAATRDLFDALDPYAHLCGEVAAIFKSNGKLVGGAVDPITSGLALDGFVEPGYWGRTGAEVLCLGAGGAAVAIGVNLATRADPADRPRRLTFVNRSQTRLEHLRRVMTQVTTDVELGYVHNEDPGRNDTRMVELPPGSLVINATGMGKDIPGSPISDAGLFPERGLAWELNYRGKLDFLQQARRQAESRRLRIEDGWVYFVHGWTQVIAQVFHRNILPETVAELSRAAAELR
jgi:shikimate 5-dehydrogenase